MSKALFADVFLLLLLLILFTAQLPATIFFAYALSALYLAARAKNIFVDRLHLNIFGGFTAISTLPALTFNHGITPVFYLLLTPILLLLAVNFSAKPLDHVLKVLKYVTWIFITLILALAAANWDQAEPLGSILPWTSTNGLPSYLIVVQIAYSIAFYLFSGRLPLISSLATFFISLIGLGRGSIIIAGLITIFSFTANAVCEKKTTASFSARIFSKIIFAPLAFCLTYYWADISEQADLWIEASKFSAGVVDEHRSAIISDYIGKLDLLSSAIGADYSGTVINTHYGGNPHNSYIRLHSFYGAASVAAIFLPLVLILIAPVRRSHRAVVFTLIGCVLLRAYSEPILFPSTLDFFYFLYFAMFFSYGEKYGVGNGLQRPHCD